MEKYTKIETLLNRDNNYEFHDGKMSKEEGLPYFLKYGIVNDGIEWEKEIGDHHITLISEGVKE